MNFTETSGEKIDLNPVLQSFLVSLILLIIVSYVKYHLSKMSQKKDWIEMSLEFPIDICTIIITLYITYDYLVGNFNSLVLFLFLELLAVLFATTIRNKMIAKINSSDVSLPVWSAFGAILVEFVLALIVPVILIYNLH